MDRVNLKDRAESDFAELVAYAVKGFQSVRDAVSAVEDIEHEFDGDSVCPYYTQQSQVIDDYEREFGSEAEDVCDSGMTYKASEWQQAQTAYAYAVAYAAYSHYFETAKQELIDALEEFESDAQRELDTEETIDVQLSTSCSHGWAAHDRELSDGTMIFESRQLDGCNGMESNINGIWISCCFEPKTEDESEE